MKLHELQAGLEKLSAEDLGRILFWTVGCMSEDTQGWDKFCACVTSCPFFTPIMVQCEIRWCGQTVNYLETVNVNENIGDGSWRVKICSDCARKLGLKEGDDLPESYKVQAVIQS